MRKFALIFLFLCLSAIVYAQNVNFAWAKQFEGGQSNGRDVAIDLAGNVITVGIFNGTLDFDPGPGTFTMSALNGPNVYISKLDPNGNFLWAKQFTSTYVSVAAVAADAIGNIYVTGYFEGATDFDPGPSSYILNPEFTDGYITRLDNSGNFIWAKQFKGTIGSVTRCNSIFIDIGGNIFTTGYFKGTVDFDPGPGFYNLYNTAERDVFISKLDVNGVFSWVRSVGGAGGDEGLAIVYQATNNIVITGSFTGTVDFDPGAGTVNLTSAGTTAGFILALTQSGNYSTVKKLDYTTVKSVTADATGRLYIAGHFEGTVDFDTGPGTFAVTSTLLSSDIFILRMSAQLDFQWVKTMNGSGTEYCYEVNIDGWENIYFTGSFENTVDFDPGPATYTLTAQVSDAYIAKLNNSGVFEWAKQITGPSQEIGTAVRVDYFGNIYTTGDYLFQADFDPGPGVFTMTTGSIDDAFVHKMNACLNTFATVSASACGPYTLNGQTYISSGIYTQIIQNANGCDSTIMLNLSIGGSNDTAAITACDNYSWNGNTLTSSGFYRDTLIDIYGCDSILNLALTINNSVATSLNITICEGESYSGYTSTGVYTDNFIASNGCDSTRTLDLTVKPRAFYSFSTSICEGSAFWGYSASGTYHDTLVAVNGCDSIRTLVLTLFPRQYTDIDVEICEGESHFAGGANQTTTGIYRDTLQSRYLCDSIIVTHLTVHPKPQPNLGTDRDICTGNVVILSPGNFASYEWQDLSTQPTFSANTTGLYWVRVTDNNECTASDTIEIRNVFPVPSGFLPATDSICQYERITIAATGNYSQYQWSTGSTLSTINIDQPGQYTLTVRDANSCTGKDTINVILKNCYSGVIIPTGFTPNQDQVNDVFRARVYGSVVRFKLQVFDRYGQMIFSTTDPQRGWDGTLKGALLPSGVFVWQCSYELQGSALGFQKGTLLLIR